MDAWLVLTIGGLLLALVVTVIVKARRATNAVDPDPLFALGVVLAFIAVALMGSLGWEIALLGGVAALLMVMGAARMFRGSPRP